MPGPIITAKPLPEWADPNKTSESDPLYLTLLRKAVGLSGITDPESAMMGMATPLVSIYKDKAAREFGGRVYKRLADKFSPTMREAFMQFEQKYPRVAAHMRPVRVTQEMMESPSALGMIEVPPDKVTKRMRVGIPPAGQNQGYFDSLNTVFHEGTHAAQALGNSDSSDLYDLADELVANDQNPFEVNAIRKGYLAGQKAAKSVGMEYHPPLDLLHNVKGPYKGAMQQMLELAKQNPNSPDVEGERIKGIINYLVNNRIGPK